MQYDLDVRRRWLRKAFKVQVLLFSIFLGAYFVLAFFDPGLLSYDLRQKFRALADETVTVTAIVLGPPEIPIVTATADCNATTGVLSVNLDWADDSNSYTFDIERDSLPLVTELASSAYHDTNVTVATPYQYQVTARGPMGPGFSASLPVAVTTPAACDMTAPAPAVTIVSFAGRNIDSYDGIPHTSNRRPLFTGTTSMADATILVAVGTSFLAQFSANSTGYWEWQPPYGISFGDNTLTVTATDFHDVGRQATASVSFRISKEDGGARDKQSDGPRSESVPVGTAGGPLSSPGSVQEGSTRPIDFTFSLGNSEQSVLQGEELKILIQIRGLLEKYTHISIPIRYSLVNMDYESMVSETHQTTIFEGAVIHATMIVPSYLRSGKYFLRIEMLFDDLNVSRMIPVLVEELPLIRLSSGGAVSYADIIRQLGWVTFFSIFLFLLWLSLLIREYAMYLQGDQEVTEYDLRRAGYFRK